MITETAGSIYDVQLREFITDYQTHQTWRREFETSARQDEGTAQAILFGLGFLVVVGTIGAVLVTF